MASTRDKKYSDPETDFGDLNEDATGEFTRKPKPAEPSPAHSAPTAPPPPASRRSTRPAPPDTYDAWTSQRTARALDDRDYAARAVNRVSPAAIAAMETGDEDDHSADEDLFGRRNAPERLTQRAPSEYPRRTRTEPGAVAPPPPRLPTLPTLPTVPPGPPTLPDAEFSLGLPPVLGGADDDGLPPVLGGVDEWADLAQGGSEPETVLELADPVVGEPGDAHSLVERANSLPPGPASPEPQREMSERFALGDFSGALVVAEALLLDRPGHPEATRVASECRARLQAMYLSRLGPVDQIPTLALPRSELKWLSLDHRAGFVLSLVDGTSSVEEIIDVAGMPMLEVLRVLFDLHNQRAIEFRPRGRGR